MDQLILQIRLENIDGIKRILQENPALDLNAPKDGRKVLAYAMEADSVEVMRVFLDSGRVDLDDWIVSYDHLLPSSTCLSFKLQRMLKGLKRKSYCITPVFFAISLENTEKFKLLVEAGADLNRTSGGADRTLLMEASLLGNFELIKAVHEAGFTYDPNWMNDQGETALQCYYPNDFNLYDLFRTGGTKSLINAKDSYETLKYLYNTVKCTKAQDLPNFVVHFIAENDLKADRIPVDEPDEDGRTPLMLAAANNDLLPVEKLLQAGADIKKCDKKGKSAFLYLAEMDWPVHKGRCDAIVSLCAFDEADFLDYLNKCKIKSIHFYDKILKKEPNLKTVADAHFEKQELKAFFEMFKSWRVDVKSDYFQTYLMPIFKAHPKSIIEYIECNVSQINLKTMVDDFIDAKLDDLVTELFAHRNRLVPIILDNTDRIDLKNNTKLLKHWQATVSQEAKKKLFNTYVEGGNIRLMRRFMFGFRRMFTPSSMTDEDKEMLAFRLNINAPWKFRWLKSFGVRFDKKDAEGRLPVHIYAQKGRFRLLKEMIRHMTKSKTPEEDKDFMKILRLAAMKSKKKPVPNAILCAIVGKFCDIRATDDEENSILHFWPLDRRNDCKNVIERFKSAKVNLIDFLFEAKNDKGECAFEAQVRLLGFHGVGLLLKLVTTSRFSAFNGFLQRLEQWQPGYFTNVLLPRYGPLLLTRAKNFEVVVFLVETCKIDPNCRVIERGAYTSTPLSSALLRRNIKKATYLWSLNHDCGNLWMNSRISSLELSRFWIKQTIRSVDELIVFLKQLIATSDDDGSGSQDALKKILDTLKLSKEQLIQLAPHFSEFAEVILDALLKFNPDLNTPIDSLGRCLLDLVVPKLDFFDSESVIEAVKAFPVSRILEIRTADNARYFADCTSANFRFQNQRIAEAFPELEKVIRFGLDARKTLSQISADDVLGSAEQCAICLDAFMQEEQLILLKCKHLFHSECLNEVLANRSSISQCPYCREPV